MFSAPRLEMSYPSMRMGTPGSPSASSQRGERPVAALAAPLLAQRARGPGPAQRSCRPVPAGDACRPAPPAAPPPACPAAPPGRRPTAPCSSLRRDDQLGRHRRRRSVVLAHEALEDLLRRPLPATFTKVRLRRSASLPSRVTNTCTFAPQSSTARPVMSADPSELDSILLPLEHVPQRLQPVAEHRRGLEILAAPRLPASLRSRPATTLVSRPLRKSTTWSITARYSTRSVSPRQGAGQRLMWNCRQGDPLRLPGCLPRHALHREHPAEDVQRLADLGRTREGTEVEVAAPVRLPGEHHPGELVFHGDHDVGIRLVVAQADVERRPMLLDEVVLQQKGLHLVRGDDPLHVAALPIISITLAGSLPPSPPGSAAR